MAAPPPAAPTQAPLRSRRPRKRRRHPPPPTDAAARPPVAPTPIESRRPLGLWPKNVSCQLREGLCVCEGMGRARRRTDSLVEPGQRRGQPQGLPRALGLELVPALRRNQPPCSLLGRPEVASNPLWKQRGGSRRGPLVPSDVTPGHLVFHSSNGFLVSVPPGCCQASRLPVPGNQRSADSMHPAIAESVGSPLSSLITSSRRKSARCPMLHLAPGSVPTPSRVPSELRPAKGATKGRPC